MCGWSRRWRSGGCAGTTPAPARRTCWCRCCGSGGVRRRRGWIGRSISGRGGRWTAQPLPLLFPLVAEALADGYGDRRARRCGHRLRGRDPRRVPGPTPRRSPNACWWTPPGTPSRGWWRAPGRELLARLDPDGIAPSDADHQRRRGVTLAERRDGTGHLTGNLTPEALAVWRTVLDALSAPNTAQDTGESVEVGGVRDDRSAAQRRHDGFLDAGHRLLRSATLPDSGGTPVTVLATLTAGQLTTRTGYARTGHGELISVPALLTAATEADIVPVVLSDTGGDPRLRTHPPRRHHGATSGVGRPRRRLRLPRLHPPRRLVPDPPHHRLGRRRPDGSTQSGAALRVPPPRIRRPRLGHPDGPRRPALHPATLARPPPATHPQHRPPPTRHPASAHPQDWCRPDVTCRRGRLLSRRWVHAC